MSWILIILFIGLAGAFIYFVFKMHSATTQQLNHLNQQLNDRLKETSETLRHSQRDIGDRLKVFGEIQLSLGRLDEMNKKVLEVSKDISSLQDLLKPPKLRGGVGETQLENILNQIFSGREEFYSFQHKFKDGSLVDAIIKIGQNIVPIDAKFPLESFQRLSEAKTDEEKIRLNKDFGASIKSKIEETSKYIKPSEKTFDFALMYIPSEAIYYEVIRNEKVWNYAISKNVIIVSANSLFPYLQVIHKGLKGLAIEKNVEEVINSLKVFSLEVQRFAEDFRLLGNHIKNAQSKFQDSEKRLIRLNDKLENIASADNKILEDKT